jgi:hypothetical protein
VTELHGSMALATVAEADDECLLVCVLVEAEGSTSVLANEGC